MTFSSMVVTPQKSRVLIKKHLKSNGLVIMDDVYCDGRWCRGPMAAWHADTASGIIDETYRWSNGNKHGFAAGKFNNDK